MNKPQLPKCMSAAFINEIVTGNCEKYFSPRTDTGIYDSSKQSTRLVKTDMGDIEIPDGLPLLVGYLSLDGSICDNRGDITAQFVNYGRNTFDLIDASNQILGRGNFQGFFESNSGEQFVCPVLSCLANKAKKLVHSQKTVE